MIICVYIYIYGGFLKWGYPKMDGLQRTILLKWMMTGGSPSLGNLYTYFYTYIHTLYLYIHRHPYIVTYIHFIYIYTWDLWDYIAYWSTEYRPHLKSGMHM